MKYPFACNAKMYTLFAAGLLMLWLSPRWFPADTVSATQEQANGP